MLPPVVLLSALDSLRAFRGVEWRGGRGGGRGGARESLLTFGQIVAGEYWDADP